MTREDKKKIERGPIGMTSFVSFAVPLIFRSSFSSIFHHVVIVLDEVGDVLTGGLTQPFSFFTDPLM